MFASSQALFRLGEAILHGGRGGSGSGHEGDRLGLHTNGGWRRSTAVGAVGRVIPKRGLALGTDGHIKNYAPVRGPTMSDRQGQISEQKKSTFGRQAGRKGLQMLGICERGNFCPVAAFYPNAA